MRSAGRNMFRSFTLICKFRVFKQLRCLIWSKIFTFFSVVFSFVTCPVHYHTFNHVWNQLGWDQREIAFRKNRRGQGQEEGALQAVWPQWKWLPFLGWGKPDFACQMKWFATWNWGVIFIQVEKGIRDVLQSDELFDCKPAIHRAFHFAKKASTVNQISI